MTASHLQPATPNTACRRSRGAETRSVFQVGAAILRNIQFTACVGGGFAPKRLLAGGGPLFSPFPGAAALAAARWNN